MQTESLTTQRIMAVLRTYGKLDQTTLAKKLGMKTAGALNAGLQIPLRRGMVIRDGNIIKLPKITQAGPPVVQKRIDALVEERQSHPLHAALTDWNLATKSMTLAKVFKELLAVSKYSTSTVISAESAHRKWVALLPTQVADITGEDIIQAEKTIRQMYDLTLPSVSKYRTYLRNALKHAIVGEYIKSSPMDTDSRLALPREKRGKYKPRAKPIPAAVAPTDLTPPYTDKVLLETLNKISREVRTTREMVFYMWTISQKPIPKKWWEIWK